MIWFISDLHINHDQDFVWGLRGFSNVQEMNEAIVARFNSKVKPEDDVYILGDILLGELDYTYISRLHGKIHFLIGNHDTKNRIAAYESLGWINLGYATVIKVPGKIRFYLSHYPTLVSNTTRDRIWGVHGHTHSFNMYQFPKAINVSAEALQCYPISLDELLELIKSDKAMKLLLEVNNNDSSTEVNT